MIRADNKGHVDEGKRGDEKVLCRYGVKERNADGSGFCENDENDCGQHIL